MAARRTKLIIQLARKGTNTAADDKESKDVVRPGKTEHDPKPETWPTDLTLIENIIFVSTHIILEDDITVTQPLQIKVSVTFNSSFRNEIDKFII